MLPARASPPGICGHVVLIKSHSCTTRKNKYHHAVLRIRDVYSGSWIRISSIPDPGSEFFLSRIRIKEFKYFNPKKLFLSSRKYDLGCSSRIRILILYPSRNQGSKRFRIADPDPHHWYHMIHVWVVDVIFWMWMKQSIPSTLADDACEKHNEISRYFLGNFFIPTSPKRQTNI